MIFDTHAHYDDEAFDADRDALLRDLNENQGICGIANVGFHRESILRTHEQADRYGFI